MYWLMTKFVVRDVMMSSTNQYPPVEEDVDCYIPELWAEEALAILEENVLFSQLLRTDVPIRYDQ